MECVFGIDVSKATANVAVLVDNVVIKQFKITLDHPGFNRLGDELNSFSAPLIIYEATAMYSRRLRAFLQRDGWEYTELNPLAAKKAMEEFRHTKTDALDAIGLARAMINNHFKPTYQEKPVYTELRDLERTYQQHNEDIVTNKNRLHRALQLTFPEVEHFMSSTDGALYWHIVQRFPHPMLVLAHEVNELAEIILAETPKRMGIKRAMKLADRLLELAQSSAPATEPQSHAVRGVVSLGMEVERIDRLKAETIEEMALVGKNLSEVQLLTSIPGIGIKTALCLIAELGDIRRFHSANAINAYIGIDLIRYESGQYEAAMHIRKRGNAYARKILYKAILNIISASKYRPTRISTNYKRKKQSTQSHGTKKIAIAAMSQFNRLMRHLILNNEPYDSTTFMPEQ
ncbi:IS110 family transposase [Lacticaseibacillus sp. 53-4]|uniref:IS110 family transposase n=1 Tax=Lacticaseibacillus sp. 53-4 TaxID=2799575 RepID=UPI001941D677|nr:IS110 family transposase [Lacticaseibacillus sp. 53-4]